MIHVLKYIFAGLFVSCIFSLATCAQCFTSPGNPIGGNVNMGVVKKDMLRVAGFYKYSYSGRYFFGDELYTEDKGKTFKEAYYDYMGGSFAYGLTDKLTLETEFGYFIDKTRVFRYPEVGHGFSNGIFSAKYSIYHNYDKRFEFTAAAGGKIPLRHKAQENKHISLAPEAQSSAGAYGAVFKAYLIKELPFRALRFFLISQYDYNFPSIPGFYDKKKYIFGQALTTSFFVTKHFHMPPALEWLTHNWTGILQVRNEFKGRNQYLQKDIPDAEWNTVPNSGSNVVFFSPQLNYTLNEIWNFSVMVDVPLYQYYHMKQMATDYAVSVNMTYDLQF